MAETLQKGQTADLGLRPGMAVEVLKPDNQLIRVTRVESYQNGAVILRDAKGDDLPQMVYNQELKLRFFHGGDSTLLTGKICGSTDQIWKVDRMESKFFKEQRAFFRQRMTTRALGKCYRRSSRGVVAKEGYPCRVLDVSAGGLLLLSGESFAAGDRLVIAGVELTPSMNPFTFQCRVRRTGGAGAGADAVRLPVRVPTPQGAGPAVTGHLHRPAGGDPPPEGDGPVSPPVRGRKTLNMEIARPRPVAGPRIFRRGGGIFGVLTEAGGRNRNNLYLIDGKPGS